MMDSSDKIKVSSGLDNYKKRRRAFASLAPSNLARAVWIRRFAQIICINYTRLLKDSRRRGTVPDPSFLDLNQRARGRAKCRKIFATEIGNGSSRLSSKA